MKLIPLTQGKFAMVDDEDFEELSQYRWHAEKAGMTWYAARSIAAGPGRWRPLRMHVALTGYRETDHVDGDGLNNQRNNLRDATRAQNSNNTRAKGGASPFKGVSRKSGSTRWRATIAIGGVQRYLRSFLTEEEAARSYDAAARKAFGPYATLNFPGPGERSAVTGELVPA